MAKRYLAISEVVRVCSVSEEFVLSLERERVIAAARRKGKRMYSLDQVDRIRVAHNLIEELGVNLEGVEVVLHMREQIINMRRKLAHLRMRLPARSRDESY